ncbi:hypothetical protein MRB53_027831 [Persea americana]|uniref:Uncharacterized protein n=1 Tax=Persea americana TaxID=3435 RepID=A0ACC2KDT8_PERAE|nr:hypothetical protein MRB53_027831 [Persea americana]
MYACSSFYVINCETISKTTSKQETWKYLQSSDSFFIHGLHLGHDIIIQPEDGDRNPGAPFVPEGGHPAFDGDRPVRLDCGPVAFGAASMMGGPSSSNSTMPRGSELNILKWVVEIEVDLQAMDRDRRREMRPLDVDNMGEEQEGFKGKV